jgi:hypothetical protein
MGNPDEIGPGLTFSAYVMTGAVPQYELRLSRLGEVVGRFESLVRRIEEHWKLHRTSSNGGSVLLQGAGVPAGDGTRRSSVNDASLGGELRDQHLQKRPRTLIGRGGARSLVAWG